MKIGGVANHRNREEGIIYPVHSRRSRGLSIGINLFPGGKLCSFDCPYCEVFPFTTELEFSPETMKSALRSCLSEVLEQGGEVRDICFSGSGEPLMSPWFPEALEAAARLRDEFVSGAKLVVITNGTGLFDKALFSLLSRSSLEIPGSSGALDIWLKIDAGTEDWYRTMNRSRIPYAELVSCVRTFAGQAAFTTQTMLCEVDGALPSSREETAWIRLLTELASVNPGAGKYGKQPGVQAVQIYGKVRAAPGDPLARAAAPGLLEKRAAMLRAEFNKAGIAAPVEVYV